MSKGKKNKKPAVVKTNGQGNGLRSAMSAVGQLVSNNQTPGKIAELTDKVQQSMAISEATVPSSLVADLRQLVTEIRAQLEVSKEAEQAHKQALSRKLSDIDDLKQAREQLTAEQQLHADNVKQLATKKADLVERLRDLMVREMDADNNFADKNLAMLAQFEQQKQVIESEIADLHVDKTGIFKAQQQKMQGLTEHLAEKQAELETVAFEQENKKRSIARKQQRVEMSAAETEQYKAEIREDVESEFTQQVSSLSSQNQILSQQIEQYQQQEDDYLNQISAFKQIERQLAGLSPQQLLMQFEDTKTQLQSLQQQLDAKPSDELEQSYKTLQHNYQQLQQTELDHQSELTQVKTQLHKNQLSCIELEQRDKQKQVIEKHNQLLQAKLDSLAVDVDDLRGRKEGLTAFPALLEMDKVHQGKALVEKIPDLADFVDDLQQRIGWDSQEQKALYYSKSDIQLFIAGLAMSQLHILQGISGTGKTSLAKAFARAVDGGCTAVSVQAGWRDKDDLIGHYNAFEKKFYERPALQGLYQAQTPFYHDRPYIILLDEVNLSRPEQYFAEFLSALELDPKDRLLNLMTVGQSSGPELLKNGKDIIIPPNVWFIGTANHDETTFEFADKTYDRAHVMELPRHQQEFDLDKNLSNITYSYLSIEQAFAQAGSKHKNKVKKLIKALDASAFSQCLADDFNVGWGNRLERQMLRFIPVMIACGSTLGFAVDHLLATKVLRAGKATARYDTQREDVELLIESLKEFWQTNKLNDEPEVCLSLLKKELKTKGEQD